MAHDPYVPGDLPGLLDGWCGPWELRNYSYLGWSPWRSWTEDAPGEDYSRIERRLDCRMEEARDRCARWLARVLGVPVGATAPEFRVEITEEEGEILWAARLTGDDRREPPWLFTPGRPSGGYMCRINRAFVQQLRELPAFRSYPDPWSAETQATIVPLALAAVCRWVGEEIRAGRITVKEASDG